MYKVFIADDEEFIVKSLVKGTRWEDYGFEVVSSANDGIEALEAINKIKPNLVFTDIRMPGISGLELIKNVRSCCKDTLFVVISGYAEFAYAQKAIDYGALGYCLKPFDENQINNILIRAKSILDNNKAEQDDILSILGEENRDSDSKLNTYLEQNGFDVNKGIVLAASIGKKQIMFEDGLKCISVKTGSCKYLYFFKNNSINFEQLISNIMPDELKGVGICEGIYSTVKFRRYIDEAYILAYQFFITGNREVCKGIGINKINIGDMIGKLEIAINNMDISGVEKVFDNIRINANNRLFTIKHAVNTYNACIKSLSQVCCEESYDDYVYSFDTLCNMFLDLNGMLDFIKSNVINCIGKKTSTLKENVKNEYFKKILNYINQNFYKEISIQGLSQDFVINPNYISQLFRKEIGMTFTEYITNLRIDYAKELLKNTEYPQNEVAIKCGYTDYFYFIRVFKKITGVTPGQYRQ